MKDAGFAIIGLGLSGEAAAELLLRRGEEVTVFDDRAGGERKNRADRLRARGGAVFLGPKAAEGWEGYGTVVVSPGIPPVHPLLLRAREAETPVISEVELASRFLRGRLVAVTGTNGKTTTVSLLVEIFRRSGRPAAAGGNIGYPLSRVALEAGDTPVVVAEISSFQLDNVVDFRPGTAVFLNLAPDHLDRYPSVGEYGAAKLKIFARQGRGDSAVIPAEMEDFLSPAVPPGVRKITWGEGGEVGFRRGNLVSGFPGGEEVIIPEREIAVSTPSYRAAALAAAAAARAEGVAGGAVAAVLKSFPGLPHRMEYLGEAEGVGFYNDSKATNPAAAASALQAFDRPVTWLAGGRNKGLDFSYLRPFLPGPVKRAILIGESREELGRVLEGRVSFRYAETLREAVWRAFRGAEPGEAVLLSPGCASFDMFEDYRARGDSFRKLFSELVGAETGKESAGRPGPGSGLRAETPRNGEKPTET